jgi:general secretion pathway protein A
MPSWVRNFGLSMPPFAKDIDDSDLWLPSSRKSVIDDLIEAMQDHQHAVLVGDPGIGKTCILRALRCQLPASGFRLTYLHLPNIFRRVRL